jgi:hypothetical protein
MSMLKPAAAASPGSVLIPRIAAVSQERGRVLAMGISYAAHCARLA